MENAWQQLLNRLAWADPEFTYDDMCACDAEEFEALRAAGFISDMSWATHVACTVCPNAHRERVRWSENGKRAFIPCPAVGTVDVMVERLRRWRASPTQLSTWFAQELALSGKIQPLPAGQTWFLGRRRVAGHTPYFFFAAIGPDELSSAVKAVREAYGQVTGMLFVPFPSPISAEGGKLRIVDVGKAASLQAGRMVVDLQFVAEQFGDGASGMSPKHAQKSLREHRRGILLTYMESMESEGIQDMTALATHLRMDRSVLYGMVRSDKRKYGESRLKVMLLKIGCSCKQWDRVPKLPKQA